MIFEQLPLCNKKEEYLIIPKYHPDGCEPDRYGRVSSNGVPSALEPKKERFKV